MYLQFVSFNSLPDGEIAPIVQGLDENTLLGAFISKITGTAYNLLYIILVNYVLQAIITGQIIDTFSSMREDNEAVQDDMQNSCFVCSIERDDFDQAGISFEKVDLCFEFQALEFFK